jgi:hypothetical protein
MRGARLFGLMAALLGALVATVEAQSTARRTAEVLRSNGACVSMDVAGMGAGAVQIAGTYVGTIAFTVSLDGGTYEAVNGTPPSGTTGVGSVSDAQGIWGVSVAGMRFLRACMTAYTSGTATVTLSASAAGGGGGSVTANVSGGNTAASNTGAAVPSQAGYTGLNIGGNLVGMTGFSLGTARAGSVAIVDGSGNQITSFGGGTQYATAAAVGTPTGTGALGWDGTNVRVLRTNASGNLQVEFAATPTVTIGTFPDNEPFNVAQINGVAPSMGNGTSGTGVQRVTIASDSTGVIGATQSGAWSLTNISGTVSLPTGAATSALQGTGNTSLASIDGKITAVNTGAVTVTSQIGAAATGGGVPAGAMYQGLNIGGTLTGMTGFSLGTARAGAMAIVDGSGNQITSFGGGTQYANGAAAATPTGTVSLGYDGTNVRALATNSSGNLQVSCSNCSGSGASSADNSAFTFGTTSGAGSMYVFDNTAPNAVTENNVAVARMSANRNPYFQLRDGAGNERGANVTAANALVVDGSAVTQPVSGTVAATQSGNWSARLQDGTGNAVTSVTAGSTRPLHVLNVDASGTAIAVSDGGAGAATANTNRVIAATDSPDVTALQILDNIVSGSGVNISQVNGVAPLMGNGASGTGAMRVTIANDSTGILASIGSITGAITLPTGASTSANQTTGNGHLATLAGAVGASANRYYTSAGTTEDEFEVKSSAGVLTGGIVTNTAATVSYLRCAAQVIGSTTPGTTAVAFGVAIPGATTGAGFSLPIPDGGISFATGITCWLVKGAADTDVAEVGANEIKVNLFYR